MDFSNAVILTAAAYGAIELVLVVLAWAFTKGDTSRIAAGARAVVCLAVSVGVTVLVANTEWGADVDLGKRALDTVSGGGLVLVGLFLAFVEAAAFAVIHKGTKAWSNSGVPMPSPTQQEALDTGALKSLERWADLGHPDTQ